jgi:hypothetical protein
MLYLIFNEGYASTSGSSLQRSQLAAEAIRLTRMVHRLLPEDAEVTGLLALMLLTDARRPARTGPAGELILMAEQDRSLWRPDYIAEGIALITDALPRGSTGPYQLQAAIAAVHDEAPRAEATDWRQIMALYELLLGMSDNPVVALNHAVAVAIVRGPRAGLGLLEKLEPTSGSPVTTGSTPPARTCWKRPVIIRQRATLTVWRPSERATFRSSAISMREPPASQTTDTRRPIKTGGSIVRASGPQFKIR